MLCDICVGALCHRKGWLRGGEDDDPPVKGLVLAHHASIASLEPSARGACKICHPLWTQIEADIQSTLRDHDTQLKLSQPSTSSPSTMTAGQQIYSLDSLVTDCFLGEYSSLRHDELPLTVGFCHEFWNTLPSTIRNRRFTILFALHKTSSSSWSLSALGA